MNETTKINFNNPDGSFNRDKWLDFMNNKINNIGFYSAWTGHTVKIVNQQSKNINFKGVVNLEDREERLAFCRRYTNFYSRQKSFYTGDRWDKEKGWISNFKDSSDISFFNLMNGMQFDTLDNLPKEKTLYKVGVNDGVNFVVYIPEHNSVRTLGFWEYAGLGLKKYLNYKVKDQLEKLGVL